MSDTDPYVFNETTDARPMDEQHVCTCGDCAVAPYDDRCKYEQAAAAARAESEALADVRTYALARIESNDPDPGWQSVLALTRPHALAARDGAPRT